jgi:hypothetical protein
VENTLVQSAFASLVSLYIVHRSMRFVGTLICVAFSRVLAVDPSRDKKIATATATPAVGWDISFFEEALRFSLDKNMVVVFIKKPRKFYNLINSNSSLTEEISLMLSPSNALAFPKSLIRRGSAVDQNGNDGHIRSACTNTKRALVGYFRYNLKEEESIMVPPDWGDLVCSLIVVLREKLLIEQELADWKKIVMVE